MAFERKDIIGLTVLFMIAFWLWTLPVTNMPFGEGDAAYHFSYSDYMSQTDHSMSIQDLPTHIGFWYYGWSTLGPMTIEYPPPYHVGIAIQQLFRRSKT